MDEYEVGRGESFIRESSGTYTLKHAQTSQIKYDLIGKIRPAAGFIQPVIDTDQGVCFLFLIKTTEKAIKRHQDKDKYKDNKTQHDTHQLGLDRMILILTVTVRHRIYTPHPR